ncbi:MAG: hypothetical protein QXK12_06650 [Candidatus Nezhaarchaeales archaeon]
MENAGRELLKTEKRRRGLEEDRLVFVGMANVANYYWCAVKSLLNSRKEEEKFFGSYLYDRVRYSYALGKTRKLPRTPEELLEMGDDISLEDVESLLRMRGAGGIGGEVIEEPSEVLGGKKLEDLTPKKRGAFVKAQGFNGVLIPESSLTLWINLASLQASDLKLEDFKPEDVERNAKTERVLVEGLGEAIHVLTNMSQGEEKHLIRPPKPYVKLNFAVGNQTLGGFFKFIDKAVLNDTTPVPVNASYIEAGGHLRLFIAYPFFSSGKLEHDPSIGVDVAEAPQPAYKVLVPSGLNYVPEAEAVTPIPVKGLVPVEYLVFSLASIAVATVALAAFIKRRT